MFILNHVLYQKYVCKIWKMSIVNQVTWILGCKNIALLICITLYIQI